MCTAYVFVASPHDLSNFFYSIVIKQIIRIAQLSEVYSKRHFPLSHPPITPRPYNWDESPPPLPFSLSTYPLDWFLFIERNFLHFPVSSYT